MASKECPTSLPRLFGCLFGLVYASVSTLSVQAPNVSLATFEIYTPDGFVLRSYKYGVSNREERSFDIGVSDLLVEQHPP